MKSIYTIIAYYMPVIFGLFQDVATEPVPTDYGKHIKQKVRNYTFTDGYITAKGNMLLVLRKILIQLIHLNERQLIIGNGSLIINERKNQNGLLCI